MLESRRNYVETLKDLDRAEAESAQRYREGMRQSERKVGDIREMMQGASDPHRREDMRYMIERERDVQESLKEDYRREMQQLREQRAKAADAYEREQAQLRAQLARIVDKRHEALERHDRQVANAERQMADVRDRMVRAEDNFHRDYSALLRQAEDNRDKARREAMEGSGRQDDFRFGGGSGGGSEGGGGVEGGALDSRVVALLQQLVGQHKQMPEQIAQVMRAAILASGGDPAFLDALDKSISQGFNQLNEMQPDAR